MKNKPRRPIKLYLKKYDDLTYDTRPTYVNKLGSDNMPFPEMVALTRSFYRDSYIKLFDMMIRNVWLNQHLTYNGQNGCVKLNKNKNGIRIDMAFAHYMQGVVGISQKFLTYNYMLFALASYIKDFYPEFFERNPFTEPEYYEYPYEHITIDFLYTVRDHHDRLAMLDYADEKKMTFRQFQNWAVNQSSCYNDEVGEEVYENFRDRNYLIYIRRKKNK